MQQKYNPYNQNPCQPQIGQPMVPPTMPPRGQWQRRAMNAIGRVKGISFPKWLSQYGVVVYILTFAVVNLMYSTYSLPWYYMLSGVVSVTVFFLFGSHLAAQTALANMRRERSFEQRIFWISFILRLVWMLLIYTIFMEIYGDELGFENSDALFYDDVGKTLAEALRRGDFISTWNTHANLLELADMGYVTYLGVVYRLTGNSIIISRLLKCVWSSLTVLLIYRLARRNFNSQVARMAAIFCALWPNFWYYCGCQLKETELVFLCVLFIEQADQMLRSRQFTAWKVIPVLLVAASLLTFRTAIGIVAFMSLLFSVVMSSSRVVSWGKRIIVGGLAILLIGVTAGNFIEEQSEQLLEQVQSNRQAENMKWRGEREHGNAFAKYAGKSVFAPLIFTIPFPTMVRPFDGQEVQQLLNGGNFVKNIISFFTILAMVMLLISGKWRDHLLPLSFMLGYLVVLVMSVFAQAERFHQPIMPFEMMFAAYGLSIAVTKPKYKRWFTYWSGLMFVACMIWSWFKLAGRGLA
jgi:4-amino-4-deoxy-L-arabinose transferase-like glycosyltransferase